MSGQNGLLFAFVLDGAGGGRPIDWQGVRDWTPDQGLLWVHLDRTSKTANRWLQDQAFVEPPVAKMLLTPVANRPRIQGQGDGLVAVLRGINLNPGDKLADMVGLHMWIDSERIITLRRRRLMAGTQIKELVEEGRGPKTASEFLASIVDHLLRPVIPVIDEVEGQVDRVQIALGSDNDADLRRRLRETRQDAVNLRRYLAPQRDALTRFQTEQLSWLGELDRSSLREAADRTMRFVEDLDSVRERATIAQEELNNRLSDRMNRTMYLLTVVAAVLLPPGLITGLLGINVGGLPGIDNPWSFTIVVLLLVVIAVAEVILLKRLKWI